jgi:hypothetical protein
MTALRDRLKERRADQWLERIEELDLDAPHKRFVGKIVWWDFSTPRKQGEEYEPERDDQWLLLEQKYKEFIEQGLDRSIIVKALVRLGYSQEGAEDRISVVSCEPVTRPSMAAKGAK